MSRIHQTPWSEKELKMKDEINDLAFTFRNSGVSEVGAKVALRDTITTPSAPMAFKRVITEVIQEAIEPILIGTRLIDVIRMDGYGTQVNFGTLGATGPADLSMAKVKNIQNSASKRVVVQLLRISVNTVSRSKYLKR